VPGLGDEHAQELELPLGQLDRCAVAGDPAQRGLQRQAPAPQRLRRARRVGADQHAHPRLELDQGERLAQARALAVVGARSELRAAVMGGDDEHRNVVAASRQGVEHAFARDARQIEVEHEQVVLPLAEPQQRLRAVRDGLRDVSCVAQRLRHALRQHRVVLRDEDPRHASPPRLQTRTMLGRSAYRALTERVAENPRQGKP
jgi:hypothetical protein